MQHIVEPKGTEASLSTFGLNNMLITKKGCCGRINTIVTDLDVPPDRPMEEELCLYKRSGKCGLCTDRCPSGALTREGFDRERCFQVCRETPKSILDTEIPTLPPPDSLLKIQAAKSAENA